jgi:hypothetical protein
MRFFLLIFGCLLPVLPVKAEQGPPMADIHLHFNWNQEELLSAEEAVSYLKQNNIKLAVVFSTPSHFAEKLVKAGGDWVIPFWTPYVHAGNRDFWFVDKRVLPMTRKALASGFYKGIGELHLVSGLGPRRDNRIFQGLIRLAKEFRVPMLIHTDASSHEYFLPVCQKNPQIRFIWAHAGGILQANEVGKLMEKCPNVWVEFSARDPWHYGGLVNRKGKLLPGWKDLITRYPDRFMTGTDPVWNAHQVYRWYEADEGWSHYDKFNRFQRGWMKQLPPVLEEKVRIGNALKFFGRK